MPNNHAQLSAGKTNDKEQVRKAQRLLNEKFDAGLAVDGIFGPKTYAAVKGYQSANNLQVDGIVGPATLAKLIPTRLKKSKRMINEIIIHCTATPEGRDYSVSDIRSWHLKRGFSDIGYHYIIHRDGKIDTGRDVDLSGAHCTGHNAHSIGVVYVGGLDKNGRATDTRTEAQKKSLIDLLKVLKRPSKSSNSKKFSKKILQELLSLPSKACYQKIN